MPDVFISHSVQDADLAKFVKEHLEQQKLSVFLAPTGLRPGEPWSPQIFAQLNASDWVFLVVSRTSLKSANVQQEIGGALTTGKKLVPIFWDITPSEAPTWITALQGVVIVDKTPEEVNAQVAHLARQLRSQKTTGQLVAGLFLAGLVYLGSR